MGKIGTNTILVKGVGIIKSADCILDGDPFPDYHNQRWEAGNEVYYNEDVYILPSDASEMCERLRILARNEQEIGEDQLGDLWDCPVVQAVLLKAKHDTLMEDTSCAQ